MFARGPFSKVCPSSSLVSGAVIFKKFGYFPFRSAQQLWRRQGEALPTYILGSEAKSFLERTTPPFNQGALGL